MFKEIVSTQVLIKYAYIINMCLKGEVIFSINQSYMCNTLITVVQMLSPLQMSRAESNSSEFDPTR
jgi:hypothetical protein